MEEQAAARPPARLMIKELVLENFKSYAGTQRIGPFHKSFSSVVGPNGSGKSNVIDGICFVFGKRAKAMRMNKVSELIHNSEGHQNLDSAKVSVYFQEIVDLPGDDDFEVVPNSEFVVSRVAHRNNTSTYYLNDRRIQQKELSAMFEGKGIDLDNNRFLILQGEVESISLMPPKARNEHEEGLLEYLEDIIGTRHYVEKIEEAGKSVDALNEERAQKLSRVKIVEKERDSLEDAKREAEEYIRLERTILQKKGVLVQVDRALAAESQAALEQQQAEDQKQLAEMRERKAGEEAKSSDFERTVNDKKRLCDERGKVLDKKKAEFKELELKDLELREAAKHLKKRSKDLETTAAKEREKAEKLRAEGEAAREEIARLEAETASLGPRRAAEETALEAIYESLKGEIEGLRSELQEKEREAAPWTKQAAEAQGQADLVKAELDVAVERSTAGEREVAEARKLADGLRDTLEKKRTEQEKQGKARLTNGARTAELKKEAEELAKAEGAAAEALQHARTKLEGQKRAAAESRSQGKVLEALMAAKASGRLPGVVGRLGSLGRIDAKYDVAVSNASSAFDFVVVDTVTTGQACVAFLREQNLARTSFIMLDKIRKDFAPRVDTPEGVPRLFDLIEAKSEELRAAFYYAVGDTVVAKDLDQASRVAYGARRWRVVTLDGKLIDTSGTMSGGGGNVRRGAMSSSFAADAVTPEQIKASERAVQEAQAAVQEARTKRAAAEKELQRLQEQLAALEADAARLGLEIPALEAQLADAEKDAAKKAANLKKSAADEARVQELRAEHERRLAVVAKIRKTSDKLEAEVKALKERVVDAGGDRLRKQKALVEKLGADLDAAAKKIVKAKSGIASGEKNAAKAEKAAAAAEEEMKAAVEELAKKKEEREALTAQAMAVDEQVKEAQKLYNEVSEEVTKLTEEYSGARRAFEELMKQEAEKQMRVDKRHGEIKKQEHLQRNLAKELAGYVKDYKQSLEECGLDDDESEAEAAPAAQEGAPEPAPALEAPPAAEREEAGPAEGSSEAAQTAPEADPMQVSPAKRGPVEGQGAPEAGPSRKKPSAGRAGLALFDLSPEDLRREMANKKELEHAIAKCEKKLENMKQNLAAIKEWRKKDREYNDRFADLQEVTKKRDDARSEHERLRKERLDAFMAAFSVITLKLKEMYQMITLGGDAELELVDSLDPFSEGIVFSVRPPKKSWKNICNLSGGEKTLSSLALVFALHHFKPTPLYFMDEIDAALDFKNVSIVANYIKERTRNAQFIIISLRNNMFELADRLVGIYKTHNCTKSVTIDPDRFVIAPHPSAPQAPLAAH
eukprot:tig00000711_g3404.t1